MSKKQKETEEQIKRYEELLRKKKNVLSRSKARERQRTRRSDRKSREHRIYQLGGMVEKMGLDQTDTQFLLGLLCLGNELLQGRTQEPPTFINADFCREKGAPFLIDGLKMPRPGAKP